MRQMSVISGHSIFTCFRRLTGCQRDPRDRDVTFLLVAKLAYTMVVSEKCDVSNFGVVTLETITRKHPKELLTLLSSSPSSIQNILLKDVLDSRLPPPQNQRVVGDIIFIVRMALKCIHFKP